MLGIRHEKYGAFTEKLPFSLTVGLKRDRLNFSNAQNWHENIEIQLFTDGAGYVLLNGEKQNVKKNDIVVVNTNVLHYTFTDTHVVYTCLIVSSDWCRRMHMDYERLRFSSLVQSDKLRKLIVQLATVCTRIEDRLYVAKANALLLKIMIELIENHCSEKDSATARNRHFDTVIAVIDYIHENFQRKISLDELSKTVFLDKYTLCKKFKQYTGQTIVEYINHYRILRAVDCLLAGHTVSQTAVLCGFENLSFFTKTFKKHIGGTPSSFRDEAPIKMS